MRKKIYPLMLAVGLIIVSFFGIQTANALPSYRTTYNSTYAAYIPTGDCTLCHPNNNTSQFTAAGNAFGANHNYAAIAPAPKVTAFSIPPTSTSLTVPINTFTGSDNPLSPLSPITGYMVTESATPPLYNATGWLPMGGVR